MHDDGYTFQTLALAAHGLAVAAQGAVEVLGLPASKVQLLGDNLLSDEHRMFLKWHIKGRKGKIRAAAEHKANAVSTSVPPKNLSGICHMTHVAARRGASCVECTGPSQRPRLRRR